MKLLKETEDATNDRKLFKSQVERRRRERMNRSLDRLRDMLLQGPPQLGVSQHRVEKAEILEQAVLFLQSSADGDRRRAGVGGAGAGTGGGGGGGGRHTFQDGFSACLQRATQFLGPHGKGLMWLGAVPGTPFAARCACSHSVGARATGRSYRPLPRVKSQPPLAPQRPTQMSTHRHGPDVSAVVPPPWAPFQPRHAGGPQRLHRPNHRDTGEEGRATKQTQAQSPPASLPLWRPWP
ncbi:transcription factor HES-7-like [Lampris incognitus]|uniref:transcription factor HES-7-like n=1 Tax=Lampris incognitus TaxID=2546036 RepID=UPI0024B5441C|nr:transcription factor HES-7-like [Lampris incognitus]